MPTLQTRRRDFVAPRTILARIGTSMGTALFESVRGGRYSLFVARPRRVITTFSELADAAAHLPRMRSDLPFCGGIIALLPYELAYTFTGLTPPSNDLFHLPEVFAGVFDAGVVWDHVEKTMTVFGWTKKNLAEMEAMIDAAMMLKNPLRFTLQKGEGVRITSNFSRRAYLAAIADVQKKIAAGYTFQVNLSQRFQARVGDIDPVMTYDRLSRVNPAPFAGYLDLGDTQILSSSPELLFRTDGQTIETHPIAGTRPRGTTRADDARLARELRSSEKEIAEHTMLVDLLRNDIGRIAMPGSVAVHDFAHIEKYARVQHLVSRVVGRVARGTTFADIARSLHPGGTITGCPKIETMKIIAELEGSTRGAYTGAFGYISAGGAMQFNILIRTMTLARGTLSWQAGGGIVADSCDGAEYDETMAKASALFEAVTGK